MYDKYICKKCKLNSHAYLKNVATKCTKLVATKVKLKTAWNLKCSYALFACLQTEYTNYTTKLLQLANWNGLSSYVFCTCTQCTNYAKCIQMLIESDMWLLMPDVAIQKLYLYKNPTFFIFRIFASTMRLVNDIIFRKEELFSANIVAYYVIAEPPWFFSVSFPSKGFIRSKIV